MMKYFLSIFVVFTSIIIIERIIYNTKIRNFLIEQKKESDRFFVQTRFHEDIRRYKRLRSKDEFNWVLILNILLIVRILIILVISSLVVSIFALLD